MPGVSSQRCSGIQGIAEALSDTVGIQPTGITEIKTQLGNSCIALFYGYEKAKVAILSTASHL